MNMPQDDLRVIRFATIQATFSLEKASNRTAQDHEESSNIRAGALPEPESTSEWQKLLSATSEADIASRGLFDALVHAAKRTPPWIRIVNRHTEGITVVVSRSRPSRFLAGAEVNASATGAGLALETTLYNYPATKRTLAPGAEGTFPLWSRSEDSAVVTIFKGPDQVLFVEYDHVMAGATVYFNNSPDLQT